MSAPSIEERREAAANLKSLTGVVPRGDNDAAGFIESLDDVLFDFGPNELGDIANRLADLIDPTPWERAVDDNHRLLDRFRELEAENARLKAHVGGMANELKDEMR